MSKIVGLDHFSAFFADLASDFVLIGGSAASVLLEEADLVFRETKDLDIVIISNGSVPLQTRLREYLKQGGYSAQAVGDKTRHYRFLKPTSTGYPEVIEIFAHNEFKLELDASQHIIPITQGSPSKLSAILLDDEYFQLIKESSVEVSGHRVVNGLVNICLKARAYCEMKALKEADPSAVDARDIEKHKKDIVRIAFTLRGETLSVSGRPRKDLTAVLEAISEMSLDQFKAVNRGTTAPATTAARVVEDLRHAFELK